ncbi:MAG: hypothetical protein U0U69_16790 [Acidimicrobiia bacterium]
MKQSRSTTPRLLALLALVVAAVLGLAACSSDLGLKADKDRSRQEASDPTETDPTAPVPPDGHDPQVTDSQDDQASAGDVPGDVADIPGFTQGVPADWPSDVPVPDGATNVFSAAQGVPGFDGQNGKALVMEVSGNPADASAKYKSDLLAQGWTESPLLGMSGASLPDGGIIMQKDGKTLMAFPTQATDNRSQMMVMIVDGDLATLLQNAGQGVPPG